MAQLPSSKASARLQAIGAEWWTQLLCGPGCPGSRGDLRARPRRSSSTLGVV